MITSSSVRLEALTAFLVYAVQQHVKDSLINMPTVLFIASIEF
jgi:hypothetical protein